MGKSLEILAIIPARGGSKGIIGKNIRSFCGKPLLAHTIEQACQSRHITRVIVSTEDEKIATVAKEWGAEVPFLRPPDMAQDQSQVADALLYTLETLKQKEQYVPDYLVMLQTTSPLRNVKDIDDSLQKLFDIQAESVVTLCATEQLLYTLDSRSRLTLVSDRQFLSSTNRQQLPPTFMLNGAMVYGIKTSVFLRDHSFFKGDLIGHVVEDGWRSVDLDEPADFVVAELLYKNLDNICAQIKNFK